MIKKFLISLLFALCSLLSLVQPVSAADCLFGNGDIREEFKNCNPDIGVRPSADVDLKVTESDSDFREITSLVISRIQILTAVIAIGVIVWIGLILVLPTSAEAKESAKAKVISVVLGFLIMIAATIIVNGIINLLYELFK